MDNLNITNYITIDETRLNRIRCKAVDWHPPPPPSCIFLEENMNKKRLNITKIKLDAQRNVERCVTYKNLHLKFT